LSPTIVHFIHGLEGNPQGTKARVLAAHFDAQTPAMDTRDFEGCVALHAERIAARRPDVVVGSSFGGAVATALVQRGQWSGPTLLLAPASVARGLPLELPAAGPIWIVHGTRDEVVPLAHSRHLAAANEARGVRLIEVDDDHSLHSSTAGGALVEWVEDLGRSAVRGAD
jgi:predicted esterase